MPRDKKKFAVFILTHGRPDNIITLETLNKSGYTGKTYLVIDNEDEQADKYFAKYGREMVIQFDKKAAAENVDTGDSLQDRRGVVYARNANFQIAKDLGLDYFLQLDDDYHDFLHRYVDGNVIKSAQIRSFDKIVDAMLDFLEVSGAASVAMSQGGDHMGGIGGPIKQGLKRKVMNSFFFRTDKPVQFVGKVNEDVNTYALFGSRGDLFFTVMALQLNQVQTQSQSGGLTGIYLDQGTYVKSFYTVMVMPSCTTIRSMGRTDRRFHHSIKWDNATPKIISSKYRKAR